MGPRAHLSFCAHPEPATVTIGMPGGAGHSGLRKALLARIGLPEQKIHVLAEDSQSPETVAGAARRLIGFRDIGITTTGVRGARKLWDELAQTERYRAILAEPKPYGIGLLYP